MKPSCIFSLCIAATAFALANEQLAAECSLHDAATSGKPVENASQEAVPVINAIATLKDGSVIKGKFQTPEFTGNAIFAKGLKLDATLVKSVIFSKDDEPSKVELKNDDKFSLTITDESFKLATILGELAFPRSSFKRLNLSTTATGNNDDGLIFYCTFDNEDSITSPAVGPKGHVGNPRFVEGKVNQGAYVPRFSTAGYFNLPASFLPKEGCIEFWAKICPTRNTFGVCDPRLFCINYPSGGDCVAEYSSNNGCAMGGFNIRLAGLGCVSGKSWSRTFFYSEILGDAFETWHHYAVSWTSDRVDLYLDGKLFNMAFHNNGSISENTIAENSILGIPHNPANDDGSQPRCAFIIDEFKIWNFNKTEFDL